MIGFREGHISEPKEDDEVSNTTKQDFLTLCDLNAFDNLCNPEECGIDVYRFFAMHIIGKNMTSKLSWRRRSKLIVYTKLLSVPDEAFGILLMESNYIHWKREATIAIEKKT